MAHRRRGHADGARLVGWEAVRARDRSRRPPPERSPFTDADLHATLRTLGARLERPAATGPWRVVRGPLVFATAARARTALERATLLLHRRPDLARPLAPPGPAAL